MERTMTNPAATTIFNAASETPVRIHAHIWAERGQGKIVFSPQQIVAMESVNEGLSTLTLSTGRLVAVAMDLFALDQAIFDTRDPRRSLRHGGVVDLTQATAMKALLETCEKLPFINKFNAAAAAHSDIQILSEAYNSDGKKIGLQLFSTEQVGHFRPNKIGGKNLTFAFFLEGSDYYIPIETRVLANRLYMAQLLGMPVIDLTDPAETAGLIPEQRATKKEAGRQPVFKP
jgi:hypothetical protein